MEEEEQEEEDIVMAKDEAPHHSSPLLVQEDNADSETDDDVDEEVEDEDKEDVIEVPPPAPKRPAVRRCRRPHLRSPSTTDEGPRSPSEEDVLIKYPIVKAARTDSYTVMEPSAGDLTKYIRQTIEGEDGTIVFKKALYTIQYEGQRANGQWVGSIDIKDTVWSFTLQLRIESFIERHPDKPYMVIYEVFSNQR